jgi:hypothetical protein
MKTRSSGLLLIAAAVAAAADPADVNGIMARVAANQDRAVAARTHWVYHQNVLTRVHYTNGKLDSETEEEYVVTPEPDGLKRERILYRRTRGDADMNTSESGGRDGIPDWFPLSGNVQDKYTFTLLREEEFRGHPVWVVRFRPKGKVWRDGDSGMWAGEVLIDKEEFQPLLVTTGLAEQLPLGVRLVLGTNVQGLGFKLTYRKLEEGVWMPESYGGEFKLRALFFIGRKISLTVRNSEFRRTDVHSTVTPIMESDASCVSGPGRAHDLLHAQH